MTYVCLPKTEEHYLVLSNLSLINITNPAAKQKINIDLPYQKDIKVLLSRKSQESFKISTYFDMILVQDYELMMAVVFHVKQKGSCLIAVEYGEFLWSWTATRKLVGFSPKNNSLKIIDNLKMNVREGEDWPNMVEEPK